MNVTNFQSVRLGPESISEALAHDYESQAKATKGKAGMAGSVEAPVRRSTAGTGLRVGVSGADLTATSEFMDVTAGETATNSDAGAHLWECLNAVNPQHQEEDRPASPDPLPTNSVSDDGTYSSLPSGESEPSVTLAFSSSDGGPERVAINATAPGRDEDLLSDLLPPEQVELDARSKLTGPDRSFINDRASFYSETNDIARFDVVPDAPQITAPAAGGASSNFDGLPDIPAFLDRRNRSAT